MRVTSNKKYLKHLECIDTSKNIWKLRWDFKEYDSVLSFEESTLNHKPSLKEVQDIIYNWHNKQTDNAILSGFIWKDMPVWLSSENQFNYKAAYDLAV